MLHTFKLYGSRIALDTDSGAVHLLDALAFDMLRYLEFPLEKNCLSTLRYDLARYESADVSATFAAFEKMNKDGVFCSEGGVDNKYVSNCKGKVESDTTVEYIAARPVFATDVLRAVESGAKVVDIACTDGFVAVEDMDIVDSELERIAKDIAKRRLGKIAEPDFDFVPFTVNTARDENGYLRITDGSILELFRNEQKTAESTFKRKCAECGLMLITLE